MKCWHPYRRPFRNLFIPQKGIAKPNGKNIQVDRHPKALRNSAWQAERRMNGKTFDAVLSSPSPPKRVIAFHSRQTEWTMRT